MCLVINASWFEDGNASIGVANKFVETEPIGVEV
jgi:hypothetical protein